MVDMRGFRSRVRRGVVAVCSISLMMGQGIGFASTPSDLRNLVGAKASSGESALKSRGYHLVDVTKGDDRIWSNWWNAAKDECVTVATVDGRYEAITESPAPDCNQMTSKDGSKHSDAVAVAAGAAALLGVAMLASKSHHRDDDDKDSHYKHSSDTAEYERGYRDGLYHQGYHNYNKRDEYSDGYERGQEQRGHETSYRSGNGSHSGYRSYVNVEDLKGDRASSGEAQLRDRGFDYADGYKKDGKAHAFWWNRSTRQCVHVVTNDGHFKRVEDASRDACS